MSLLCKWCEPIHYGDYNWVCRCEDNSDYLDEFLTPCHNENCCDYERGPKPWKPNRVHERLVALIDFYIECAIYAYSINDHREVKQLLGSISFLIPTIFPFADGEDEWYKFALDEIRSED